MSSVHDLIGKPVTDDGDVSLFDIEKEEVSLDDQVDLLDTEATKDIKEEEVPTVESVRSLWLRVGGMTTNKRMESMGNTVEEIILYQRNRVFKTITILVVPLLLAFFLNQWAVFGGVAVLGALVMWFMDYYRVAKTYESFQFIRQLDFNKFVRMLMPYLRGSDVVLYKAFNKMKDRLDDGTTRTALVTLITKMNSNPESREPFEEFAREASGQERSILIMQTLYDYQKSSNDSTTINELGKLVDEELSRSIDEIITRKDDSFETESYMLGFLILVPAMAYFLAIAVSMLQEFQGNM